MYNAVMHTPRDFARNPADLHNRLIKHRASGHGSISPAYCGQFESFSPLCGFATPLKPRKNKACGLHTSAILSATKSSTFPVNVDSNRTPSRGKQVIITAKSDYGLRAALFLAAAGHRVRLREISESQHIPESICAQVMRKLVGARIVASQAGPAGGYTLARAPEYISVASVLAAADRDICIFRCVEDGCDCDIHDKCSFQVVLRSFGKGITGYLENLSLADLNDGQSLPEFNLPAMSHGKAS